MLPMLITLPGPGASLPPVIDVEVVQPTAVRPKPVTDPATTSALPKLEDPSAKPRSEPLVLEEAAKPATAQPSPVEVPPDDMPQQVAAPDTPALAGIDALTPEPLSPILVMAPTLAPPAPEEVKLVQLEPDPATTSSIVPVEMNPAVEGTGEVDGRTAPPPSTVSREAEPATEPQPEIARADPKEEAREQALPAEDEAEPTPPKPAAPRKAAAKSAPKPKATAKAASKPSPDAAKKRQAATVKQVAQPTRRVVRRPQTSINQGIMSLFSLKPPAGTAAARRPAVQHQ
jgi:hypothetical protein